MVEDFISLIRVDSRSLGLVYIWISPEGGQSPLVIEWDVRTGYLKSMSEFDGVDDLMKC